LSDKNHKEQAIRFKEKAIEAYEASLRANPGYDEIYFNLGVTYSQMGNNEEAVKKIETALFINPLLRDGYASLGNIYVRLKRFDKARDTFETALLSFPEDKEILLNLGFIYIELGKQGNQRENDEKAFTMFKKAYQLDPKFQQAWNNLKLVSKKLGRNEPLVQVPVLLQRMEQNVSKQQFSAVDSLSE